MRKKDEAEKMEKAVEAAKVPADTVDTSLKRDILIEHTVPAVDPEKSADPDLGAVRQVFLRRKHEYSKGLQFLGMKNLIEVMKWLGPDFYALTQGDPIAINNQVIKLEDKSARNNLANNLLLIIHDPRAGCYHVVSIGSWIVYDDDFGYSILSDEKMNEIYHKVYDM
ncbi:MAG: hypothetical protein NC489_09120 [Ruminococcus flavefaciens]|nr:hypothetical protein [Ruminococcus flavefaciens]